MSGAALALRYILFAVAAMLANLLVQRLVLATATLVLPIPQALAYVGALGAGTMAGLVLKYVCDKRWIFDDRATGIGHHGRQFSLYVLMGLATTVVFWGTETAAWLAFGTTVAREAGGVLGLSVGYVIKYHLDRRFVFATDTAGLGAV